MVLEAMASGTPVVGSNTGGIADMIRDGENGLLVPPGQPNALAEAINRILSEPALRSRLAQGGSETARRYDYTAVGGSYAAVLRSLMEGYRGSSAD